MEVWVSDTNFFGPALLTERLHSLPRGYIPGTGCVENNQTFHKSPRKRKQALLPTTLSSALVNTRPCRFSATHWYIPASDSVKDEMVRAPLTTCILFWTKKGGRGSCEPQSRERHCCCEKDDFCVLVCIAGATVFIIDSMRPFSWPVNTHCFLEWL